MAGDQPPAVASEEEPGGGCRDALVAVHEGMFHRQRVKERRGLGVDGLVGILAEGRRLWSLQRSKQQVHISEPVGAAGLVHEALVDEQDLLNGQPLNRWQGFAGQGGIAR